MACPASVMKLMLDISAHLCKSRDAGTIKGPRERSFSKGTFTTNRYAAAPLPPSFGVLVLKHADICPHTLVYTFMSRNKQSQKYLIGRSYKNDKFDWPLDLVTVT